MDPRGAFQDRALITTLYFQNVVITSRNTGSLTQSFPARLSSSPQEPLIHFLSLRICLFQIFHVNWLVQYFLLHLARCTKWNVHEVHPYSKRWQDFASLCPWVRRPHLVSPLIRQRSFGLFPLSGACE